MSKLDFSNYNSTLSWRYGSDEMRKIFSEENKYKIWRKIWVALARAENKAGLVSNEELDDLEKQKDNIDINKILENEKETKHDVVAAIREFADKAKIGGGKIHLGATSMDIVDNADAVRVKEALQIIEEKIKNLLKTLSGKIERYADMPCIGYTHLQPAEPTTVGYRLSFYAQDLLADFHFLQFVKQEIKAKGIKGAVGTAASYGAVLEGTNVSPENLETDVMEELGIEAALISTQVAPRKYDYLVLSALNSVASTLAKFAGDLRILQSPSIGEWSEPFGKTQVGSSAMPFKRNPISAEKVCSLARYVSALPNVALENATLSYLERTLDDSANKRIIMAEGFLALDEILETGKKLLDGLVINEQKVAFNLAQYAPFAATEGILVEAVKNGADRQEMHETLRKISLVAWQEVQEGKENDMATLLSDSQDIKKYVTEEEIKKLLDVTHHIGTAPNRALKLVDEIKNLSFRAK
jgi:adenylosuccinate lyase